jgi:hypothetical protein
MMNISLLFGAGFRSKSIEIYSLVLHYLVTQMFATVCPNFSVSILISSKVGGIVHI